jgi:phage terminase large subunit
MDYLGFDWKSPDYQAVFAQRLEALDRIRAEPGCLPGLKRYYAAHIPDFINDFGVTYDPRNKRLDLPTIIPFVLFPKQRDWVEAVIAHWRAGQPLLSEKSRDWGLTWLAGATAASLCIFNDGLSIGFGSRKVELVDRLGNLAAIFPKIRMFLDYLPEEFRGGYVGWRDGRRLNITIPATGSVMGGEGGDQMGRGDRTSIYFVDESSYLEDADAIDAALSQTTNCRVDISTPRGMNNSFARKRWEGKIDVFICDWRDDPRKDEEWYQKQLLELDPVVVAQEVDRDYSASVHGIVVPGAWVRSAIGFAEKVGIKPTGALMMALDVADEGRDKNACAGGHGIEVSYLREWTGKGGDIYATTEAAFEACDELGAKDLIYDADGLGAGVRGDARIINERRAMAGARKIPVWPFRGSSAVVDPEAEFEQGTQGGPGRKNEDYFLNLKAQGWWSLRRRFQRTHRWITLGIKCDPAETISLRPDMPLLMRAAAELSQVTYKQNAVGKLVIDKVPDGMKSPNLGDAVMMKYAPRSARPMAITPDVLRALDGMPRIGAGLR